MNLELFSTRIKPELKDSIKEYSEVTGHSIQNLVQWSLYDSMFKMLKHETKCAPGIFYRIIDKHGFKKVYHMTEKEFSNEIEISFKEIENEFKKEYGEF